ncbi:MAG: hypothetical protein EOP45_09575, partial [Sphingobacteriaceae bacterium]
MPINFTEAVALLKEDKRRRETNTGIIIDPLNESIKSSNQHLSSQKTDMVVLASDVTNFTSLLIKDYNLTYGIIRNYLLPSSSTKSDKRTFAKYEKYLHVAGGSIISLF